MPPEAPGLPATTYVNAINPENDHQNNDPDHIDSDYHGNHRHDNGHNQYHSREPAGFPALTTIAF